jgi:hypothetical protein
MMIFSKDFKGIWMLSAHRQREDHSDLHRWHNNASILTSRSVEMGASRKKRLKEKAPFVETLLLETLFAQ